ncbi:hypothetical protein L195_g008792 [Trifolium pratense]|uniref:Uncharacterized protein n=1 Tax=Trifolium pratense TaxID=57577 RepID=A0A2K3PA42_TRIPR|nr:hypothetical protein L195_g008792 [Trifolium pratense]
MPHKDVGIVVVFRLVRKALWVAQLVKLVELRVNELDGGPGFKFWQGEKLTLTPTIYIHPPSPILLGLRGFVKSSTLDERWLGDMYISRGEVLSGIVHAGAVPTSA